MSTGHGALPPTGPGRLEESLVGARPELARRYAVANGLNTVTGDRSARVGIIAAGLTFRDTQEALAQLGGVTPESLGQRHTPARLGMVSPSTPQIRDFADGLTDLIVVEEKRPFVETAVRAILYGRAGAPRSWARPVPRHPIPPVVCRPPAPCHRRRPRPGSPRRSVCRAPATGSRAARSALPANSFRSSSRRGAFLFLLRLPAQSLDAHAGGSLVAAGIGCHTLVVFMGEDRSATWSASPRWAARGGVDRHAAVRQ